MLKLYGFSLLSLLLNVRVAVLRPSAPGTKVTTKVVLLNAATEVLGCVVTVKSAALIPETATEPSVKVIFPLLKTVNVLVLAVELKSVQSAVFGVVSLSAIEVTFPCTSISGIIPNP